VGVEKKKRERTLLRTTYLPKEEEKGKIPRSVLVEFSDGCRPKLEKALKRKKKGGGGESRPSPLRSPRVERAAQRWNHGGGKEGGKEKCLCQIIDMSKRAEGGEKGRERYSYLPMSPKCRHDDGKCSGKEKGGKESRSCQKRREESLYQSLGKKEGGGRIFLAILAPSARGRKKRGNA